MNRLELSRRTLLRGGGVALALPLLEAMLPRRSVLAQAEAPRRFVAIYFPCGNPTVDWAAGGERTPSLWHPATVGSSYTLTPLTAALEPVKADITMINGINLVNSGDSQHPGHCSAFLSGELPPHDGPLEAAQTSDQMIAEAIGETSPIRSLVLSPPGTMDDFNGQSGIYGSSMSWANASTPMPRSTVPSQIFDSIVGQDPSDGAAEQRIARNLSILDFVGNDAKRLQSRLGAHDRAVLDQYLTNVHEIETRLANGTSSGAMCAGGTRPGDANEYPDDIRLKLDLLALALQCDVTRVATLVLDWEGGDRNYGFISGASAGYHGASHEDGESETEKYKLMVKFHLDNFVAFLGKMKAMTEGDATVLDNSIVLYGSGIGNYPGLHGKSNLPLVLAGRGAGTLNPGRSIAMPSGTTIKLLNLTLMQKMGLPVTSFYGQTDTTDQL